MAAVLLLVAAFALVVRPAPAGLAVDLRVAGAAVLRAGRGRSGRRGAGRAFARLTGTDFRHRRGLREAAVDAGVVEVVVAVAVPADELLAGGEDDVIAARAGLEEVGGGAVGARGEQVGGAG